MTVVIKSWRRGSTSYMSGTRVATTGHMDSWGCSTIDSNPFVACSWFGSSGPAYITQSCYNGLTDTEKSQCTSRYHGIVTDSGHWTPYLKEIWTYYNFNPECIVECFSDACNTLLCADVICEPTCYEYDLYETECISGVCEQATLIEPNSYDCEYTDPTIIDMLIDNSALVIVGLFGVAMVVTERKGD